MNALFPAMRISHQTHQNMLESIALMCGRPILRCEKCGEWPQFCSNTPGYAPNKLLATVRCACWKHEEKQTVGWLHSEREVARAKLDLLKRLGLAWCEKDKVKT